MLKKLLTKQWFLLLLVVLCVVFSLVPLHLATQATGMSVAFNSHTLTPLDSEWDAYWRSESSVQTINLPTSLNAPTANDCLTLTTQLPTVLDSHTYLFFRSSQQVIRIYIDRTLVYEYGTIRKAAFGRFPGSSWHLVPLNTQMAGQTLTLEISSPFKKYAGYINPIYIGNQVDCLYQIISNSGFSFFICMLTLIISLGILLAYICFKELRQLQPALIFLALFGIFATIWSMGETRILQCFIANRAIEYCTTNLSFLLMFIPFLIYIKVQYHLQPRKLFDFIIVLTFINFIVTVTLQLFSIIDICNSLSAYQFLLIISIISVFISLMGTTLQGNKKMSLLFKGYFILSITALIDLFKSLTLLWADTSFFFRIGLFVFICLLVTHSLQICLSFYSEKLKAQTLRELAFYDVMTSLKNRTAFERHLEKLATCLPTLTTLCIIVFDVNNLKQINDTEGHLQGDELIKSAATLITSTFNGIGEAYRIGGDEFVVILKGIKKNLLLEHLICFEKELNHTTLSIAYGFAYYLPQKHKNLREVFEEADQYMYLNKNASKQSVKQ